MTPKKPKHCPWFKKGKCTLTLGTKLREVKKPKDRRFKDVDGMKILIGVLGDPNCWQCYLGGLYIKTPKTVREIVTKLTQITDWMERKSK
jgi:hypothetical protein